MHKIASSNPAQLLLPFGRKTLLSLFASLIILSPTETKFFVPPKCKKPACMPSRAILFTFTLVSFQSFTPNGLLRKKRLKPCFFSPCYVFFSSQEAEQCAFTHYASTASTHHIFSQTVLTCVITLSLSLQKEEIK
jgi:hypothetical protein